MLSPEPHTLSTATATLVSDRPVVRCSRCRMVQYRTAANRCRRCLNALSVPPPPVVAPPVASRPDVAAGVRELRRLRRLTQKQLAVASQLPRTYISRIENGRIIPGLVTLERVAGALGVAVPALLGFSRSNGNGNGNGNGHANGNGAGGNGSDRPSVYALSVVRDRGRSLEAEACLGELLRFSGVLTGAQRLEILARVRQMIATRGLIAH